MAVSSKSICIIHALTQRFLLGSSLSKYPKLVNAEECKVFQGHSVPNNDKTDNVPVMLHT